MTISAVKLDSRLRGNDESVNRLYFVLNPSDYTKRASEVNLWTPAELIKKKPIEPRHSREGGNPVIEF